MKQKNLILMVVAVGCGLVAAFLTTQINAKPKVEQVEVIVAAKDLAVGTLLAKNDLKKLITKKMMNKDNLPPIFVVDENELADKRLSQPVRAETPFDPQALSTRGVIILPEGKDMVSLPVNVGQAAAGFVGPGSKVDVLATMKIANKLNAFPLLVDMQILAVDTNTTYDANKAVFPNMSMVSLAVTQEQALLLSMAKQRGCHLELLLRHPNKPIDTKYDMAKVKKILQDDSPGGIQASERGDVPTPEGSPPPVPMQGLVVPPVQPEISPATPKSEMVKVLKATADIAANTEITKDLLAQSFAEKEIPKETSELLQAYGDLTPYLGQVFKTSISKDQLVIKGMVGYATAKVAPPDAFVAPKAEPKAEPEVAKPVVSTKRTHDMAGHTSSGTLIYRYEEVAPGEWKLKKVLTPEQVAREQKQSGAEDAPANPATPEKAPDAGTKKID